jgi:hypothetical protein
LYYAKCFYDVSTTAGLTNTYGLFKNLLLTAKGTEPVFTLFIANLIMVKDEFTKYINEKSKLLREKN